MPTETSPVFQVLHADHNIMVDQMVYIQQQLIGQDLGFFIKEIALPEGLGWVPNAMHGPCMGDEPITDDEVTLQFRGDRAWTDRLTTRPPRPCRYVQAIGMNNGDEGFVLFTVYGGPLAPQNPNDPYCADPESARAFWATHALSIS
jgi:hypothetical protein